MELGTYSSAIQTRVLLSSPCSWSVLEVQSRWFLPCSGEVDVCREEDPPPWRRKGVKIRKKGPASGLTWQSWECAMGKSGSTARKVSVFFLLLITSSLPTSAWSSHGASLSLRTWSSGALILAYPKAPKSSNSCNSTLREDKVLISSSKHDELGTGSSLF